MSAKKTVLLHEYAYDPLDRHVKSGGSQGDETQVFYNNDRVATEIKGKTAYRVFETDNAVLAQLTTTPRGVETALIAHDDKRSTLATLTGEQHTSVAYTAAGYSPADEQRVLGFNGERDDKTTGHYLLGNGYRAFNPVLMRFNSPDSWSPFGEGGINAYAYCDNNWPNMTDPSGHFSIIKAIANLFGRTRSVTGSANELGDMTYNISHKTIRIHSKATGRTKAFLRDGRTLEQAKRDATYEAFFFKTYEIKAKNKVTIAQNIAANERAQEELVKSVGSIIASKSPTTRRRLLDDPHINGLNENYLKARNEKPEINPAWKKAGRKFNPDNPHDMYLPRSLDRDLAEAKLTNAIENFNIRRNR